MSPRALNRLLVSIASVVVLTGGAALWYYTMGRKPHVLISEPISGKGGLALVQSTGPNESLLLTGSKATLFDFAAKKARWSFDLDSVHPAPAVAAAPTRAAVAPAAPKAATPAAVAATTPVPEKPDPLLTARVKRDFAKLDKRAADLNQKKAGLKTQLQIEAFNVEAAKYHADLTAARLEAAPLHRKEAAPTAAVRIVRTEEEEAPVFEAHSHAAPHEQILATESTVWIARGARLTGLERGTGHVVKDLVLAGQPVQLSAGPGHVYALAPGPGGHQMQMTRILLADNAVSTVVVPLPPRTAPPRWTPGSPRPPETPDLRTVFSAARSELLQVEVRLVEKKIVERKTLTGDSVSDFEEADRKTTGGWGADAAVFAQALAKDAERDATGGKELLDQSTYEATLRRPFEPGTAAAKLSLHGRLEVFSTATLDILVAGRELTAFDHHNKKLWQAQLAKPIAEVPNDESGCPDAASAAQPALEAGDRLYFIDTAYLSAFQRDTGKPQWRLPMAGIRKVQLDTTGALYLATGSGPSGVPQLLKLEAATGKVLWKVEKYDDCFVSGGDLYVTRETRNSEDMVNAVFDKSKAVLCRWKLYKLSRSNGEPQWEWFQTRRPQQIAADHKRVSLLFGEEMQVLTSIAL